MAVSTTNQVVLDLRNQQAAAKEATRRAVELQTAYADPRAIAMIQKQTRALKDLAREEEAATRSRRKAEVGGLAEGLEHASKKMGDFKDQLSGVAYQAGIVFAQVSAGVTGFALLGDTGTATATLATSFKLLAQSVGEVFLPYFIDAAGWIQKAANWIRNLDEGTKGTIAKFIIWTGAIAGIVMIGGKLLALLTGIASKALAVAAAVERFLTMSVGMSPMMAALTTLGLIVAGVATAFGLLGGAAKGAGDEIEGVSKKKVDKATSIADQRALSDADRERLEKVKDDKKKTMEELEKISKDAAEKMKKAEEESLLGDEGARRRKAGSILESSPENGTMKQRQDEAEQLLILYGKANNKREAIEELRKRGWVYDPSKKETEKLLGDLEKESPGAAGKAGAEKARQEAAERMRKLLGIEGGGPETLLSMRGMPTPGIMSGEAYGAQLQMRSLEQDAGGSAEAELLRRQLEALLKQGDLLDKIAENTDPGKQPFPFGWGQ